MTAAILADAAPHRADAHAYAHAFASARAVAAAARLYTSAGASAYASPHRCARRPQPSDDCLAFLPFALAFGHIRVFCFCVALHLCSGGVLLRPGTRLLAQRIPFLFAWGTPRVFRKGSSAAHPAYVIAPLTGVASLLPPLLHGFLPFTLTLRFWILDSMGRSFTVVYRSTVGHLVSDRMQLAWPRPQNVGPKNGPGSIRTSAPVNIPMQTYRA
ncbi:hypothetical protein DFH09DRAFT_1177773 [Mycena vulgaris]|nr:hypothetical protein DFH09DRAFT_1177773 [Mycena vulgaris]